MSKQKTKHLVANGVSWSPILSSKLGNSQRWEFISTSSFLFDRKILSPKKLKTCIYTPWKGVYKRLSFIETAWNKVFIVDLKAQQVNLCNFFFNLQSEQQRTLSFHSFHTKSRRSLHTFSYTCYRTFRISLIGRSHVPAAKVHPMLQTTSNVKMTHGKCQVTSLPLPSPSPVSLRSLTE